MISDKSPQTSNLQFTEAFTLTLNLSRQNSSFIIDDIYEIEQELAQTANSQVYLAKTLKRNDSSTSSDDEGHNSKCLQKHNTVVIKVAQEENSRKCLKQEFEILNSVSHPHIIQPISYNSDVSIKGRNSSYLTLPYS